MIPRISRPSWEGKSVLVRGCSTESTACRVSVVCKQNVDHVGADDVAALAASALHERPHILVVADGCEVAERLTALGFAVTAIGACPTDNPAGAVALGDRLRELRGQRFRAAVLCDVAWLEQLPRVIAHIESMLESDARVIIDDVNAEALDDATMRWFIGSSASVAGESGRATAELLAARWLTGKRVRPTGSDALVDQLLPGFVVRAVRNVECLYRHLGRMLPIDAKGSSRAMQLRDAERRAIADGAIRPVGIQIVAERRGELVCAAAVSREIQCHLQPGHAGLHFWRSSDGSRTFEWG